MIFNAAAFQKHTSNIQPELVSLFVLEWNGNIIFYQLNYETRLNYGRLKLISRWDYFATKASAGALLFYTAKLSQTSVATVEQTFDGVERIAMDYILPPAEMPDISRNLSRVYQSSLRNIALKRHRSNLCDL